MSEVTHSELVEAARRWLAVTQRCTVVLTELVTTGGEIPDALGWQSRRSILVECKISRADFRCDADKSFRRWPEYGMGNARYFLTPPGLVKPEELPKDWGLLEWNGKRVRTIQKSTGTHKANNKAEVGQLVSALRRVGQINPKGISIQCFTMATRNTATFTMRKPPHPSPLPPGEREIKSPDPERLVTSSPTDASAESEKLVTSSPTDVSALIVKDSSPTDVSEPSPNF